MINYIVGSRVQRRISAQHAWGGYPPPENWGLLHIFPSEPPNLQINLTNYKRCLETVPFFRCNFSRWKYCTRWAPTSSPLSRLTTPFASIYFRPFIGATYPCHSPNFGLWALWDPPQAQVTVVALLHPLQKYGFWIRSYQANNGGKWFLENQKNPEHDPEFPPEKGFKRERLGNSNSYFSGANLPSLVFGLINLGANSDITTSTETWVWHREDSEKGDYFLTQNLAKKSYGSMS